METPPSPPPYRRGSNQAQYFRGLAQASSDRSIAEASRDLITNNDREPVVSGVNNRELGLVQLAAQARNENAYAQCLLGQYYSRSLVPELPQEGPDYISALFWLLRAWENVNRPYDLDNILNQEMTQVMGRDMDEAATAGTCPQIPQDVINALFLSADEVTQDNIRSRSAELESILNDFPRRGPQALLLLSQAMKARAVTAAPQAPGSDAGAPAPAA